MRVNSRVQKTWLRLFSAADSSPNPRIERIEEGYYAVVRKATKRTKRYGSTDHEDCRAVKPSIPNLARTRAVYLNHEGVYELSKTHSLHDWAGHFGQRVERGSMHAFAIVNTDIYAQRVSAFLHASGWKVEHVGDNFLVNDGRFTEIANLLRGLVQMVLARSTFAEAARSLKAELADRFLLDSQLFARFEQRFAQFRPAVFHRYFTVCPQCPHLDAGWDYWQTSHRDAHVATEIFEQAMKEFETLLAMPQKDWLPGFGKDCCGQSVLNLEVTHD